MPRTYNPFANSPYPSDPNIAAIGSGLVNALFGDPEARAQQQMQRAQMEEMAAQAERARAGAAYDTERTRGVRGQNDTVYGSGDGSLAATITDPAVLAAIRAHPEGLNLEQLNKGLAGVMLRGMINPRLPAPAAPVVAPQAGVAGAVTGGADPALANPGEEGVVGEDGAVTVGARKVAPPPPPAPAPLPKLDEQTLRLIGALQGDMPSETTAYTPEFSLKRQGNELASQERRTRYSADRSAAASMYGSRQSAAASRYSADRRYAADIYSTDQNNNEKRWEHTTPGAGTVSGTGAAPEPLSAPQQKLVDGSIDNAMPFLKASRGMSQSMRDLRQKVSNRASELLATGRARSASEAVSQARDDFGVTYTPGAKGLFSDDPGSVTFHERQTAPTTSNW